MTEPHNQPVTNSAPTLMEDVKALRLQITEVRQAAPMSKLNAAYGLMENIGGVLEGMARRIEDLTPYIDEPTPNAAPDPLPEAQHGGDVSA